MKKLSLLLMFMFIFVSFSMAAELGEDQKGSCVDGVQNSRSSLFVDAEEVVAESKDVVEITTVISD